MSIGIVNSTVNSGRLYVRNPDSDIGGDVSVLPSTLTAAHSSKLVPGTYSTAVPPDSTKRRLTIRRSKVNKETAVSKGPRAIPMLPATL
jgi:hypothetical protein